MRILHISPSPIWDGEDKKGMPSIYLSLKGFVEAGHEVIWLVAARENREREYEGIRIIEFRVPAPIAPVHRLQLHRVSLKWFAIAFSITATRRALALARRWKPDVVYGHFLHGAPVARLVGRALQIPNVTRMYGTFLLPYIGSRLRLWRKPEEVLAFKVPCDYFIMTDDGMGGGRVALALGVPPERLKLWRNGVDKGMYDPQADRTAVLDELRIPADHKIVLAVSRLIGWKRLDRLISAMPQLIHRAPRTTVVIVGDGEDRPALEQQARDLGVHDRVRFTGMVPHARVGRYTNAADIFVSLYDWGNVGNPLLEAICCGRCVVSLDVGSTNEINQHGQVALLLDVKRLDTLPDVLAGLLADDERRLEYGRRARAYAEQHLQTWPERVAMEVRLIERLVDAAPRVAPNHPPLSKQESIA